MLDKDHLLAKTFVLHCPFQLIIDCCYGFSHLLAVQVTMKQASDENPLQPWVEFLCNCSNSNDSRPDVTWRAGTQIVGTSVDDKSVHRVWNRHILQPRQHVLRPIPSYAKIERTKGGKVLRPNCRVLTKPPRYACPNQGNGWREPVFSFCILLEPFMLKKFRFRQSEFWCGRS